MFPSKFIEFEDYLKKKTEKTYFASIKHISLSYN